MLTLSKKAQAMPASPIRKLVPYADAAKKRGVKVFDVYMNDLILDHVKITSRNGSLR